MSELPMRYPDEINAAPGCTREAIEQEIRLEEARTRYSRAYAGGGGSSACEQRVFFDMKPSCWAHNEECLDRWECINGWVHGCPNDVGDNSLELCDMHYYQIVGARGPSTASPETRSV